MITNHASSATSGSGESTTECALQFTHGAPTAEEIAAVTAIISALGANASAETSPSGSKVRSTRLQRRRLLASAPQPWRTARH
ncbi:hypothetical protein CQ018_14315 [Arthrobacter sp. MYb227]|uniref:acyl-CoA carboxylase subunit epsilon n=1 Tax=Arthrobacter sp. MYb227 TaxID=1848601 RepID=UPI000CFE1FAD|nr:acyl-CoA carboxylase subunit epsilon [Arthrobacter sp. MYb227]PQZ91133.1 hypothetical protein CQ018_14315 [Arthrobacter sp. MYb227]